ncbi:acetyl esterase/lipase [Herbihabitans rhizosphaerae]|uniref:Acetyl esterase/lipase n=1 Tax=Herbihabitans rhizosphaerae TaxID=1872711 RepID=A0A4Q7L2M7_9PSEU|nr:alpha/beta hydrolase fold domain-containing protein [Herbihabitans rhizosphaerae]RZS43808.1 acetyl esterase/lipase [Herbihabitans rhizosphaerae]
MAAGEQKPDERQQPGRVLPLPAAPDAIELRHLRAFVAVADELNFGRAASRLYLSQPALSRQIRTLERLVGGDLLRRSTHRVELTLAGDALLDRARRLLTDLDDAISATQSIGGEFAERAARAWQSVRDLTDDGTEIEQFRGAVEDFNAGIALPEGTRVRPVNAGGVPALAVAAAADRPLTVLHLHGGAYVAGSAFGFRPLAGALAVATDAGILLPDYRLAPEHPFPAAVDDAVHAYTWMLDTGTPPAEITVAGDSAGAGLVVSMLITLKDHGLPQPGRVLLLCPWVDLTCETWPPDEQEPQPILDPERFRRFAAAYLNGHDLGDPRVSPLTADLSGLPPMLLQAGTGEPLAGDAHRLTERARSFGVDARLELYPSSTHMFQYFWSFLPEAANALEHAGAFTRRVLD